MGGAWRAEGLLGDDLPDLGFSSKLDIRVWGYYRFMMGSAIPELGRHAAHTRQKNKSYYPQLRRLIIEVKPYHLLDMAPPRVQFMPL